jgi:hypothetical protein
VRSKKIYDDSDDDDDEVNDSVDLEVVKRSTRNRKQISYAVDSESEEDSADDFGEFSF